MESSTIDSHSSFPVASSEDDTSLMTVIVDTNPFVWASREGEEPKKNPNPYYNTPTKIKFAKFLEHFLIFINSYLIIRPNNLLCVIASHPHESKIVFPSPSKSSESHRYADFDMVKNHIAKQIKKLITSTNPSDSFQPSMLSGAMSLALCYINRLTKDTPRMKARILVIQVSPDVPSQHIAFMNCIFSAQKMSIPIDSCIISDQDSPFLQQATHITDGIYIKPTYQTCLIQYLQSVFLIDVHSRKFLDVPKLTNIDYRASCFCHKKTIDIGFVCSVCLSIFCNLQLGKTRICSTCGARFPIPKLVPFKKGLRPPRPPTTPKQ